MDLFIALGKPDQVDFYHDTVKGASIEKVGRVSTAGI